MSDESKKENDCLECRLISGFGVIAIGFYIYSQAKRRSKIEANAIKIISGGAICLGVARLLNVPILKKT